ncbi:KUP/HAK/KT family potassium transporter [uncultured Methanomethylovorans sp.]|uniref:KUP/HAK/KT family potassium transporter n=1 Tax=uncultured Methanomethylovorans sp. TaxID=183759 RepID=UPI002AA77051|nr:KUP/HAK/KT family potassium transporter [uncultured Methanomethylovorans sp.]
MLDKKDISGIVKSTGLVFGDIGTSPIYTLTVIFIITASTPSNIMGVLSLIVWTLVTLVSIEYAWLAMNLGKKGEGGTIVLKELLVPMLKSGRKITFITILAYIGISFLVGDGIITPAISILSAVEGIRIIPGLQFIRQETLMLIAAIIAICLFSFQKKGTEKIAWVFGPLMVVWFLCLAFSGIASIIYTPSVLKAINPYYAIDFLLHNGWSGFFVLSEVILCATGGEALYADMGHLGREPILKAWRLIFIALVLSYLGQGAFLIRNPDSRNILYEMIFQQAHFLYLPFLMLSIVATVIASQAMISGMFSVAYQAVTTRIAPLLKIGYTSNMIKSQIYISVVNWLLLIAVLFAILEFRESSRLAAAYGLTVTGTMVITGIMMTSIYYLKKDFTKAVISMCVTYIAMIFLISNTYKLSHGGYWSLSIALLFFSLIMIYTKGQQKLYQSLAAMNKKDFLEKYNQTYNSTNKIGGTALFFAREVDSIPQYITHTMFDNGIIYMENILVTIVILDIPFGVTSSFKEELAKGLKVFEITMGYMEVVDVAEVLNAAEITEKTIFYGVEDIVTDNPAWKIFSVIKRISPSFVQFHKLSPDKIHGVVTRVEM